RPYQVTRRSVLARSYLPLLSLRDAANTESYQSLSPIFAALVVEIPNGVEPFRRTRRAVVFVRATNSATCRGRVAGYISDFSHHQRQSFVPQLRDDHSVPRLL